MSAFVSSASFDRSEFRRWSFSAMLVAAAYGAIALVVLGWHIATKPLDSNGSPGVGPFFFDLAPPLGALSAALPGQPDDVPEEASAVSRDNGTESAVPQRNDAEAGANVLDAPVTPVAPDRDAGGAGAAAPHAFATGLVNGTPVDASHTLRVDHASPTNGTPVDASHALRVDPGPIDTSITVTPPLHPHKDFGASDRNRMILLRPTHPGEVEPSRDNPSALTNTPGAHGISSHGSLDHRPGAHIQDRVNAAIEREELLRRMERARNGNTVPGTNALGIRNATGTGVHSNTRNAIGAAGANNGIGNPKSGVINGTVRNALGVTVAAHPSAHGTSVDELGGGVNGLRSGVSPDSTGLKTAALPAGGLNGRGMVARAGTGLTALGGPAKTATGVLNGSDFHPKH